MDPTSPRYKKGHLALVWGTERARSLAGGGTRWRAGQAAPSTLGLGPHRAFVYWYLEQEWEGGRGTGGAEMVAVGPSMDSGVCSGDPSLLSRSACGRGLHTHVVARILENRLDVLSIGHALGT